MQPQNSLIILRSYLLTRDWFVGLIAFCWLFMVYTEIPLAVGDGKTLPSLALILFLPLIWPLINKDFRVKHLIFLFIIIGAAILTLLVKFDIGLLAGSLFKLLQLSYSVTMCLFTYLFISSIKYNVAQKVLLIFLGFIVVGCIAERLGLIRGLTESYRIVYASAVGGADIDQDREISLAGFKRPYLFTSEPSVVGIGFFAFSIAYCMLNNSKIIDIIVILLVIVMLQLLASPTVLFVLIILFPFIISKYKPSVTATILTAAGILTIIIAFSRIGSVGLIFEQIYTRILTELVTENNSMYARIYVPYMLTMPTVLPEYPLFGVGFGNYGYINLLFGYNINYFEGDSQFFLGVNGFVTLLMYFGIIGNIIVYSGIYYLHKSNHIRHFVFTLLFIILLGQITGSIAMPRFWCYIGLCMASLKLRTEHLNFIRYNYNRIAIG